MKIGVLTSSRADFGIYLPLLQKLKVEDFFDLTIIAFGTHGSPYHGETISEIQATGFKNIDLIQSLLLNDNPNGVSTSYGLTVTKFADYWGKNDFDLIFCLGDRYEMSAAVQAGIPFGIKYAHLHGGETTLGAIDNIYRHQITLASTYHFTSTEIYREKVISLLQNDSHVYNVGALSLDHLEEFNLVSESDFKKKYGIPDKPFVLITFHPETAQPQNNQKYATLLTSVFEKVAKEFFLVITLPNADTNGSIYRKKFNDLKEIVNNRMITVENFGKRNYFSAMKYASFLLGNTSSGIIEAASFKKYVVNVGNRQKGRVRNENVFDCQFSEKEILETIQKVKSLGVFEGSNIYKKKNSARLIVQILKSEV